MFAFLLIIFSILFNNCNADQLYNSRWHYKCDGGLCKKESVQTLNGNAPLSLSVCQLFCGQYGTLWPKPTGHLSTGNQVVQLDPNRISFSGIDLKSRTGQLFQKNLEIFKKHLNNLSGSQIEGGGMELIINLPQTFESNDLQLTLNTKENYTLELSNHDNDKMFAKIDAHSYFGARHALETLSQLIVFDDLNNMIKIIRNAHVQDGPVYPYRGILLDTSRNFIDKATILRTIEAMSMSKLNTFHWHITDSHSFPYASKTWPLLSEYGAYSNDKVYTKKDVAEIVEFGLIHGVRVLPEFDAPAHVGEGWQWVGDNATVCFKAEPWQHYCVEPPCGQLNPTNDKVYEILEGIYRDMIDDFQPDIFHMGGDEVSIKCWNSSDQIKQWMGSKGWDLTESNFYKLWNHFQTKAYEKFIKAYGGKETSAILWTSGLTNEENIKYLDPKKYIIQVWTQKTDSTIRSLLQNKFRLILSNYDVLYLDCGFGSWIGEGNNWCSPYKGWNLIYENSPRKIGMMHGLESTGPNLILGAEATLWSEQADSSVVDSRIWPRSAAMAERLWAEPDFSWNHAEQRMLRHRERMVRRGISADSLKPEWCLQNQGQCN